MTTSKMRQFSGRLAEIGSKAHLPEQNMGLMDRVVRSAIGGALFMNWINKEQEGKAGALCRLGGFVGAAFVTYGVTGRDPLLCALHANTFPGDANNLGRKVKEMLPEDFSARDIIRNPAKFKRVLPVREKVAEALEKLPLGKTPATSNSR